MVLQLLAEAGGIRGRYKILTPKQEPLKLNTDSDNYVRNLFIVRREISKCRLGMQFVNLKQFS